MPSSRVLFAALLAGALLPGSSLAGSCDGLRNAWQRAGGDCCSPNINAGQARACSRLAAEAADRGCPRLSCGPLVLDFDAFRLGEDLTQLFMEGRGVTAVVTDRQAASAPHSLELERAGLGRFEGGDFSALRIPAHQNGLRRFIATYALYLENTNQVAGLFRAASPAGVDSNVCYLNFGRDLRIGWTDMSPHPNTSRIVGTFTLNRWIRISHHVDLDTGEALVSIDGVQHWLRCRQAGELQTVDFERNDAGTAYLDDFTLSEAGPVPPPPPPPPPDLEF